MNIVIDSNIFFSALIRNSTTRRIILSYDGFFIFPAYVFDELNKHKSFIIKKSGLSDENFNLLIKLLLRKIIIVPENILLKYRDEAKAIIESIDINDVLFIACALAYSDSVLWSDDKDLKKQSRITVWNTSEVISYLNIK